MSSSLNIFICLCLGGIQEDVFIREERILKILKPGGGAFIRKNTVRQ